MQTNHQYSGGFEFAISSDVAGQKKMPDRNREQKFAASIQDINHMMVQRGRWDLGRVVQKQAGGVGATHADDCSEAIDGIRKLRLCFAGWEALCGRRRRRKCEETPLSEIRSSGCRSAILFLKSKPSQNNNKEWLCVFYHFRGVYKMQGWTYFGKSRW